MLLDITYGPPYRASLSRSSGEMTATNVLHVLESNSLRGPLYAGEAFNGEARWDHIPLSPLAH